ncbi:MAG: hypothetical protein U0L49_06640 [Eubacterium sp.]|nr:hypothetical protein [Eubacterium sp.]
MKLRRILALLGIIFLLAIYGSTMVFALMDSPLAKGLLMGAVFFTIAVPVLLYAILLVAKNVRGRGVDPFPDRQEELKEKPEEVPEADRSADSPEAQENTEDSDIGSSEARSGNGTEEKK